MRLGARPWIATAAALLFSLSPTAILYENWLFYTYPTAMVLVLAAIAAHRFARTRAPVDGTIAFLLMAAALYTRGIFHIVWLGAIVVLFVWVLGDRRRVIVAALPALILSGGLYLKNLAEFGVPGTSSWVGMNLSKLTTWTLAAGERQRAVDAGATSELALILPFQPLKAYPDRFHTIEVPPIPALSQTTKSSGRPNLNHLAYVDISKQYLGDSLALMRRHPGNYLRSVGRACLIFLRSPSEYPFLRRNRRHVVEWDRLYSATVYGALPTTYPKRLPRLRSPLDTRRSLGRVGWIWAALLIAGVVFAFRAAGRARLRDPALAATMLFAALTVVWVALVGNLVEIGENNRFRVLIEPLVFALVAAGASRLPFRAASTGSGELPAESDNEGVGEEQSADQ
jgi:hypothetical protein